MSLIVGRDQSNPMRVFMKVDDKCPHPPENAHDGDMCLDLYTPVDFELVRGETKLIETGVYMEFPPYLGARIEPRSGLSLDNIDRRAGVIDPCYRGDISVAVHLSHGARQAASFKRGDRIAQLRFVLNLLPFIEIVQVDELGESERGEEGFGSTGR